jgi:hypothetical protein
VQEKTENVIELVGNVLQQRHPPGNCNTGSVTFAVAFHEDPAAADAEDAGKADLMRLCEISVFLDIGMVSDKLNEVRLYIGMAHLQAHHTCT